MKVTITKEPAGVSVFIHDPFDGINGITFQVPFRCLRPLSDAMTEAVDEFLAVPLTSHEQRILLREPAAAPSDSAKP